MPERPADMYRQPFGNRPERPPCPSKELRLTSTFAAEGAASCLFTLASLVAADIDCPGDTFTFFVEFTVLGFTVDSDCGTSASRRAAHGVTGALLKALTTSLVGCFSVGSANLDITLGAELILIIYAGHCRTT